MDPQDDGEYCIMLRFIICTLFEYYENKGIVVCMHTMKAYGGLEEQLRAILTSTVGGGDLHHIPATLQIGKQPS
jgi:hypothetical protein